jgi:hypothetical protein
MYVLRQLVVEFFKVSVSFSRTASWDWERESLRPEYLGRIQVLLAQSIPDISVWVNKHSFVWIGSQSDSAY